MKKIILPILLFFIFFSVPTNAQQALGLTAIPPRLEVTVNPGQVITKEIKVRNDSPVERIISTTVKDFIVTDDQGTPVRLEGVDDSSNRWASSNWITVSPSSLVLKPKETKTLVVTIIAPDNPTAGGHYAMILHSPKNEVTLSETGSTIETFVGTLVYITVPGDINENAQVKEFSAPSFSEYGPVSFNTIISNLSDIHISPIGSINVTNWLGGKTASLAIDSINIFPGTTRELKTTLNRKFLFGRYTARLSAGYGLTGQALTAALVFWVIPWRLILLILAAVGISIVLIILIHQKTSRPGSDNSDSQKVEALESELEELKKKYQDRH